MCGLITEAQWVEGRNRYEPSPVQFTAQHGQVGSLINWWLESRKQLLYMGYEKNNTGQMWRTTILVLTTELVPPFAFLIRINLIKSSKLKNLQACSSLHFPPHLGHQALSILKMHFPSITFSSFPLQWLCSDQENSKTFLPQTIYFTAASKNFLKHWRLFYLLQIQWLFPVPCKVISGSELITSSLLLFSLCGMCISCSLVSENDKLPST